MNERVLRALATLALLALASGVAAAPADPLADLIGPLPVGADLADPGSVAPAGPTSAMIPATAADGQMGILPPTGIPRPDTTPAPGRAPPPGRPDFRLRATLYHSGATGVGTRDASGCRVVPMRTVAVDRRTIPLHSILFIRETVGLTMPDGSVHDGYWYASDTGGAIHGARIDLFTGMTASSMRPLMGVNTSTVSVTRAGIFHGCPTRAGPISQPTGPAESARK